MIRSFVSFDFSPLVVRAGSVGCLFNWIPNAATYHTHLSVPPLQRWGTADAEIKLLCSLCTQPPSRFMPLDDPIGQETELYRMSSWSLTSCQPTRTYKGSLIIAWSGSGYSFACFICCQGFSHDDPIGQGSELNCTELAS